MAKRRARPRYTSGPKKGKFMSDRAIAARRAARKRKPAAARKRRRNPHRKSNPPAKRRSPVAKKKKRRTKRNMPARSRKWMDRIIDGLTDGLTVSVAEGTTRLVPSLLRLPQGGPTGIAIQAATAAVVGMVADAMGPRGMGRIATAGAFAVPMKTAALSFIAPRVPLVSAAFIPTLSAYPRVYRRGMGAYSRKALPPGNARPGGRQGFNYARGFTLGAFPYYAP